MTSPHKAAFISKEHNLPTPDSPPVEPEGCRFFFLKTFGCQMNEHDSSRIESLLRSHELSRTDDPAKAGLIVLNTCSIRDKAEHKVYSTLGRLRELKKHNPEMVIAVGGCMAQQEGRNLINRFPVVDLVFGPHALSRLADHIKKVTAGGGSLVDTALSENPRALSHPAGQNGQPVQALAYLAVMQGCNNFCAYCVVPYVRGREHSRPVDEILEEARDLAASGVKEITLLGQNVNAFGKTLPAAPSFASLVRQIHEVDGLERIRFVTSHPRDFSDELIDTFGRLPKLCEHIHLPIQSGSDAVLRRMNRGYTRIEYLEKVSRLRTMQPAVSITSDIIVGFPGETESDFEETLSLVREVSFDGTFSFMFSPRPGTPAARFDGQVPEPVRQERLARLQSLQLRITFDKNRALVGTRKEVLVTGPSKKDGRELSGRTGCNRVVNFKGHHELVGRFVQLLIERANKNSLRGTLINA